MTKTVKNSDDPDFRSVGGPHASPGVQAQRFRFGTMYGTIVFELVGLPAAHIGNRGDSRNDLKNTAPSSDGHITTSSTEAESGETPRRETHPANASETKWARRRHSPPSARRWVTYPKTSVRSAT